MIGNKTAARVTLKSYQQELASNEIDTKVKLQLDNASVQDQLSKFVTTS